MKITILSASVLTVALFAGCSSSFATSTDWLSEKKLNSYVKANMSAGGTAYPTAVDCKDNGSGPMFTMTYKPMTDPKPFYRWNWLHTKSSDLRKAVGKLKLSDERHLKYRVIQKSDYVAPNGTEMSCAIVYR